MYLNFKDTVVEFLKKNPSLTAANMAIALSLSPLNDILLPHLYGKLVNVVERGEPYTFNLITVIVALLVVQVGTFVKDYVDLHTQPMIYDFIKTSMVHAMLKKYDGDLSEPKTGDILSKIVRSPEIVSYWTSMILEYFIPQMVTFAISLVYFMYYDVVLGASMFAMVAAIVTLLIVAPWMCMRASIVREKALNDVHEDVEDIIRNLVSVYSNDTANEELAALQTTGKSFKKANAIVMSCLLKYKAISVPFVGVFICLVVCRCCYLIKVGKLKTGNFVSIFMITTTMVNTLMWLVNIIKDATLDVGAIVHSQDVFSKSPSPPRHDNSTHTTNPPFPDGIGFFDATFSHSGAIRPVLSDVSVHFEAGERTVITGDIGSGKSTMLKLMMAFMKPQKGDLYVNGSWYSGLNPRLVRRMVAYMPQDAILFDRTIAQNILYGSRDKTVDDVHAIIEALGVWGEFGNMEKGVDTMAGKNGSHLSGGQRQLVWFMRIVLRNPAIIILDEPTASMDTSTKRILMQALDVISRGKTIIMVTHDDDLLKFATRRVSWL